MICLCPGKRKECSNKESGVGGRGGVRQTYEIPNSKHQITNKSQIPILNDQNRFGISNLVIVIYLIFVICDLEFLFFKYCSTPKPLNIFTGKTIELLTDPKEQVFCD